MDELGAGIGITLITIVIFVFIGVVSHSLGKDNGKIEAANKIAIQLLKERRISDFELKGTQITFTWEECE